MQCPYHTVVERTCHERNRMVEPNTIPRISYETVDPEVARVLSEKTEAERLQIAWGMWRSARRMIERILRSQFPEWSDAQVNHEVARRMSRGG